MRVVSEFNSKSMRIWVKRIGIVFLIPAVLLLSVSAILYIPPVRNIVVGKAADYVSKSVGINIEFERIGLSFPLNLSAHDVSVTGPGSDTLLYLNKLTLQVRLKPLLRGVISVKRIRLETVDFNTGDLIDGMVVKGRAGNVFIKADSINPAGERALLNSVALSDADIDLFICDTTAADTSKSDVNWLIELRKAEFENVAFSCRLPCDSIYLDLQIDKAVLSEAIADLGKDYYAASGVQLSMPKAFYGANLQDAAPGFDASHICFSDVRLSLDSLSYASGKNMQAILKECSARERSGVVLRSATGRVVSDSAWLHIPSFSVQTDHSTVQIQVDAPWPAIDGTNPRDNISVGMTASVGREDVMTVAGDMPGAFRQYYPDTSFHVAVSAGGNIEDVALRRFRAELPGAFDMNITGNIKSVTDEKLRRGTFRYKVETRDMDFLAGILSSSLQRRFRAPDSMHLAGSFSIDKGLYAADAVIRESEGEVKFSGKYDTSGNRYEARLDINGLEPVHFMPDDSIMLLNARVHAKGQGTDLYRSATWAELDGKISEIYYGNSSISEISLTGNLKDNHLQAELNSGYPLIKGRISVDGDMKKNHVKGTVIVDVDALDFHGLRLTEAPLTTSFQVFSEIESNLKKDHSLDVTLGNWNMITESQAIQPKMLTLAFRSEEDTVRASFHAGDLNITLTGNADLTTLADEINYISGELGKQLQRDSTINFGELRPYFPDMSVWINAERDNPLYNFLQEYNLFFETFNLDMDVSPEEGLRVNGELRALVKDTLKIDTIRLNVWQDTLGLQYAAGVSKTRFRNQEAFRASAHGYIRKDDADLFASYTNSSGEKGLHLGINIKKALEGFDFRLYPEKAVIAFLPFTINDNNYFRFKSMKDMNADLRLDGDAYASLWIHSDKSDESTKEIMVELNRLNLENISARFGSLPALKGLLNATLRYEPLETSFMIVADGDIDDLYYENGRIGELLASATYIPVKKGSHQVDLHLFHDMSEISSLSVLYREGRYENSIDGVISIDKLPLNMFNAMLPGQTARLDGALLGDFSITGTDANPLVSGTLQVDKGSAYIVPSATTLRFDSKPIKVTKNKVDLDKYSIYGLKNTPLVIDGTIDATNTDRPTADLRISATNLQLIDSKKTPESQAYGRLFVDLNATLTGPLQSLRMRGNLHVLGNTNLTYVMLNSPLEVQDSFNDLVTFSYFADTLPRYTRRPFNFVRGTRSMAAMSGTNILMNIKIDPVVRIRVDLDEEQSNFVELRGGGDLSLQYSTQGDISLNGRYTLSDGTIRYSIPVIPLTDFSVRNGSYVDWTGNPMNPQLNITAFTRVRSAVEVDGLKKMTDFNSGIQLRNKLEDVSVQFIIEAPTEAAVQNQLTSMDEEERSKQAISLLVTGVFLARGGAGNDNLDVGMALNTLLQREIKNMIGSLLGDVPFSFDVETYDGTQQGMGRRIDYIGRFYKGFFNERFNTTLGLRYSTKDPVYGNKLFLDDVSLEYILDADGSRAVKAFRNKEYENLFEGEIVKIGASFSLSRKVKRFGDLFFPRKQDTVATEENEEEPSKEPGYEPPDDPEVTEDKKD
jgi:hypothetical protein